MGIPPGPDGVLYDGAHLAQLTSYHTLNEGDLKNLVRTWTISRTSENQHQLLPNFWNHDFWREVPANAPFAMMFQAMMKEVIEDARDGRSIRNNAYKITVRLP
jgi:hypothetical protein